MQIYKVGALSDETQRVNNIAVVTQKPIDKRLLQIAGLVLDGGLDPSLIRDVLATAQCYVSVEGKFKTEKWIDDAISGGPADVQTSKETMQ